MNRQYKHYTKHLDLSIFDKTAQKAREVLNNATIFTKNGNFQGYMALGTSEIKHPDYKFLWTRDNIYSLLYDLTAGTYEHPENYLLMLSKKINQCGRVPISINPDNDNLIEGTTSTIGHIHSIDSTLLYLILTGEFLKKTSNKDFYDNIKTAYKAALNLSIENNLFDPCPLIASIDCTTHIDRPHKLYGYVAYNQVLLYGALRIASDLKEFFSEDSRKIYQDYASKIKALIKEYFWINQTKLDKLNTIIPKSFHRNDEFSYRQKNPFNIKTTESEHRGTLKNSGYFIASVRTGYYDYRFDSLANLMAIAFGITTDKETEQILNYIEINDIDKPYPMKILWPALSKYELQELVPADETSDPYYYQNCGIWPFIGNIYITILIKNKNTKDAYEKLKVITESLKDNMPEWVDGNSGQFVENISNANQTWSAATYLMALEVFKDTQKPFFYLE